MIVVNYAASCDLCGEKQGFQAEAGAYQPLPEGWIRVEVAGMASLDVCPQCKTRTIAEAETKAAERRVRCIEMEGAGGVAMLKAVLPQPEQANNAE